MLRKRKKKTPYFFLHKDRWLKRILMSNLLIFSACPYYGWTKTLKSPMNSDLVPARLEV